MKSIHAVFVTLITAAVLVSGCANTYSRPTADQSYSSAYGVVDSIEVIPAGDPGIGAGTVIGGVVGGLLGNQVGGGRGKTAATIAGVAGGAVVGHEIEKKNQTGNRYQVTVRLDNGRLQTVTQDDIDGVDIGSRVRIENDRVYRD